MTGATTELLEALAWEHFRAAALIHDTEHTPRTWLARQGAYHDWAALFLHGDGDQAP